MLGYISKIGGNLMLESYRYARRENVTVCYTGNDRRFVAEIMEEVLYAYKDLKEYFQLGDKEFSIRVILAMSRREYDYICKEVLKVRKNEKSKKNEVAIVSKNDLLILSPFAYEDESTYIYERKKLQKIIYNQVVNIFNEFLSLDPKASSRWFGQGLAIYLSNLWNEDGTNTILKNDIQGDTLPSLKEIQENEKLYKIWAWTIVKYIEEVYGKEIINKIIRSNDENYVFNIIGTSITEFEVQWTVWLKMNDNIL